MKHRGVRIIYRIALCEDEKIFAEEHEQICHDILNKLNIDHLITIFTNGKDFLKGFSSGYDLILLDIIMDETNGMELARKVRTIDKHVAIVFITSTRDYALQGYDVNALHYLMKPVKRNVLEKLIAFDYRNRIKNDYFVFESSAGKYQAAIKDIICFEIVGRQVAITLKDGMIYYAGKLSDLLAMLPNDQFVRCHQSFAINIFNIRELTRFYALAIHGIEVPVSRTYLNDVRKAFLHRLKES